MFAAAAIVFAVFSHQRLYHSDLWGHLSYGRLICAEGSLSKTEPFMPLAKGVEIKATAWASQVIGYQIWAIAGPHGLQVLHGLLLGLSSFLLMLIVERRTQNWLAAVIGMLVAGGMGYHQICILRPQLAGVFCFACLLWLLESKSLGRRTFVAVAVLFACWTNLHPSFPAGLILISLYGAVVVLTRLRQRQSLVQSLIDDRVRKLILLAMMAAVAACLNPYGVRLFFETIAVSANPNLRDLLDWKALRIGTRQGRTAVLIAVLLLALLWRNRREVSMNDLVLFVVTGMAAFLSSRMINWWAPITGVLFGAHVFRQPGADFVDGSRRLRMMAMIVAVGAVAASNLPRAIGVREAKPFVDVVSAGTPVDVAPQALRLAGDGLIWSPNTWGDYLAWTGDGAAPVFCTTHAHVVPRDVWLDYRAVSMGDADCLDVLEERSVSVVLVGKRRRRLLNRLDESEVWVLVSSTGRAKCFQFRPRMKKGLP
jgi:hypothetical protein